VFSDMGESTPAVSSMCRVRNQNNQRHVAASNWMRYAWITIVSCRSAYRTDTCSLPRVDLDSSEKDHRPLSHVVRFVRIL
jgi:hypothetical protein